MAKSKLDTSYDKNLTLEQQKTPTVQQNAIAQPVVDTSYQNNAGTLYGGHDAGWWQQQYSSQSSDETRNMVRKAADYYGYKIDENTKINNTNAVGTYGNYMNTAANSQGAVPTVQSYSANSPQVAAYTSQSQTQDGTTAPVGTDSVPIDSYEEFLRKRGEMYKENLDRQKEMIEDQKQRALEQAELQRQQAEQNAEKERERSVVDARSSYEQNKATYGAQAETLANMGLTGSGYSEYINAQAYANQRAETQNANANAEQTKNNANYVANNAKLEIEQNAGQSNLSAETTYAENMANNDAALAQYKQQKEEEKKSAYSELLNYANNGTYDSEQLKSLADKYGLSEADINNLTGAAETYKNNKYKENYANAIDNIAQYGSQLDNNYLDNMYKMDLISMEQYEELKNKYNTKLTDEIKQNLSSGDSESIQANIGNADKYYSEGKITQETYQGIYNDYSSKAVSGVSTLDDYNTTKKTLEEYKNSGKLSQSQYNELLNKLKSNTQKKLDTSKYKVTGLGRSLVWTDDIDVYIDGKEYDLVSGHIVDKDSTKRTLNEASTGDSGRAPSVGTVIVVCGEMYIYKHSRKGDNWHKMENDMNKVSDAVKAWNNQ